MKTSQIILTILLVSLVGTALVALAEYLFGPVEVFLFAVLVVILLGLTLPVYQYAEYRANKRKKQAELHAFWFRYRGLKLAPVYARTLGEARVECVRRHQWIGATYDSELIKTTSQEVWEQYNQYR